MRPQRRTGPQDVDLEFGPGGYGPQLGVRCPDHIRPSQYSDSQRCEELHRARELGFVAERSVRDAIVDLRSAFVAGKVPNAMTDDRYYNIKRMQGLKLR